MTTSIDTSTFPLPNWVLRPRGDVSPKFPSDAITPISIASPPSRSIEDTVIDDGTASLELRLFDNAADLKIRLSRVAMHLADEWRRTIFKQLDILLDIDSWDERSSEAEMNSFVTFLRFIIFAMPGRLPSMGIGPKGNILAAWRCQGEGGEKRLSAEFLDRDATQVFLSTPSPRGQQTMLWSGHVAELKAFLEQVGAADCLG